MIYQWMGRLSLSGKPKSKKPILDDFLYGINRAVDEIRRMRIIAPCIDYLVIPVGLNRLIKYFLFPRAGHLGDIILFFGFSFSSALSDFLERKTYEL